MTGRHHVSARQWFRPRRPHLKPVGWILLGCLVVDIVVLGTLGVSDMNGGVKVMPSGPAAQPHPLGGAGPASPPVRVCGNSGILGGGPQSAKAGGVPPLLATTRASTSDRHIRPTGSRRVPTRSVPMLTRR